MEQQQQHSQVISEEDQSQTDTQTEDITNRDLSDKYEMSEEDILSKESSETEDQGDSERNVYDEDSRETTQKIVDDSVFDGNTENFEEFYDGQDKLPDEAFNYTQSNNNATREVQTKNEEQDEEESDEYIYENEDKMDEQSEESELEEDDSDLSENDNPEEDFPEYANEANKEMNQRIIQMKKNIKIKC